MSADGMRHPQDYSDDGLGAARGILNGLALSVAFWAVIIAIVVLA